MTGTPTMVWGDFVTCLVQTGQPFKFRFEDLKTNCTYLVYKFRLTSAATSLVTGGEIWVKMAVWSTSLSSGISIQGTPSPSWTFLNWRRWSGWPLLMVLLPADIETFYAVEARIGWDCSSEEVEWLCAPRPMERRVTADIFTCSPQGGLYDCAVGKLHNINFKLGMLLTGPKIAVKSKKRTSICRTCVVKLRRAINVLYFLNWNNTKEITPVLLVF
jgi:hypothetical protein